LALKSSLSKKWGVGAGAGNEKYTAVHEMILNAVENDRVNVKSGAAFVLT